jgi:hypothetical protein
MLLLPNSVRRAAVGTAFIDIFRVMDTGANPTITNYNASVVQIDNQTNT